MKKDDTIYLRHVLECIGNIDDFTRGITRDDFGKSVEKQDAVIRRMEIIGEAVKKVSSATKNKYMEVEWKKIAGTRDILIHAYFSVDLDLVWDIVDRDLPNLKKQIIMILKELQK